ncbi:MAG: Succinyl-diaminopimelate desuccinylase [Candidatus Heimdallarchaeota archaeon AB_125]|nr:MAG: Succinyl-diaminopimelate desuccinylase [Candidatus Heimdallarchaeota archaeon AB_125]
MNTIEFFINNKQNFLNELFDLIRIPSISRHKDSVQTAANWLENKLRQTADYVEQIPTTGNPVILAEWEPQYLEISASSHPTLLFYGHYDVQPPEPLDEWISPPFEPEIRDGRIFARGIGDNKGQFFAHIVAIECLHKLNQLGVNIKLILDGEEELGSPYIDEAISKKQEFFEDVDLVIVSDGPADPTWKPTLEFGARGIITAQFELQTAKGDVHSGNFGGIQPNPVWDLISILKTMKDDQGKCLIEGFYDDVFTPTPAALKAAEDLNRDPEVYKEQLDITYFGEEKDLPITHRLMFRPTFNIRGISSGSVRENARTIIPKEVVAELDIRLVPNQVPEKIKQLVTEHLDRLKSESENYAQILERCEVNFGTSFYPMFTPLELPWTEVLAKSITEGFEEEPLKIPLAGGSLPLYSLYKATGKPIYIIPYAQPDEDNHAPNENMMVEWFEKGVKTSIAILNNLKG